MDTTREAELAAACTRPSCLAPGHAPAARQATHRDRVMENVDPDHIDVIRLHLQRGHALDSDRFRQAIDARLHRHAGPTMIGRPRKRADSG